MASISGPGSSAYKAGHKVVLKSKMSQTSQKAFKEYNYKIGKSIFALYDFKKNDTTDIEILIKKQSQFAYFKDEKGKIVKIIASYSGINSLFNHAGGSSKADTNKKTEIKENVSMYLFENPKLSEDDIIKKLGNEPLYETVYYESAIKQLKVFKDIPLKALSSYYYERQGGTYTKKLYEVGIKLSKKAADNWNPADVWMIDKTFAKALNSELENILKLGSLNSLNDFVASNMYNKLLIPISLKQVTGTKAKLNTIDADKLLNTDPEYDLSFEKLDFSESFFNFIITTKASIGFGFRAGFKASKNTMNVSLEGRYLKAGYQAGAVDAKEFPGFIKKEFGYDVRTGSKTKIDLDKSIKELQTVKILPVGFKDYKELQNKLDKSDSFTQQRFCNITSYIYAFLNFNFDKVSKFGYYSSKKITKAASAYYIIF